MDHALFAQHRAIGQNLIIQVIWIFDGAIDMDGLRRFNENFGYGLAGRRIECSSFGRYRWVVDQKPSDIFVADRSRPRAELLDWADEHAQLPIDPERGPGWHLGVQPLTDGSTVVSLVISHYLVDGLGLGLTIANAVFERKESLGYPPPLSRSRLGATVQDALHAARDAPEVGRALVEMARGIRRRGKEVTPPSSPPVLPSAGDEDAGQEDDVIVVPGMTMTVDLDAWESRAQSLGGTGRTLLVAFAAKLAEHMGRTRSTDGAVTLQMPISDRKAGDTRALAMSFARLSVNPSLVTTDLGEVRAAVKQALTTMRAEAGESPQAMWLVPFTPKRTLKRISDAMPRDSDLPVLCSNLGEFSRELCRLDGTRYGKPTLIRVTSQRVTRQWLEHIGGQITVQSLRVDDRMAVSIEAYQPGAENTKRALRELAERTLAEFNLTGQID